jgi:DNA-binding NarL/FixJ family response regulator/anti-sigma regulatory factor (Ser/Thr protein kinase)
MATSSRAHFSSRASSLTLWRAWSGRAFCLFIPLVYYDVLAYSMTSGQRSYDLAAAGSLVVCFANLPVDTSLMIAALMAVAYVLAMRTTAVERSQTEAKQLRDSGYEMAMLSQAAKPGARREARLRDTSCNAQRARAHRPGNPRPCGAPALPIDPADRCALMVTKADVEERQSLSTIRDTLSQAMDSIRASVYDLHEESIDLRTQVEALVREFTFCPIRLDYRLELEPGKDIAYCFIAIVKEGLNNIIRHSNATQVTLALLEHPALYQLVLQDNGSGIERRAGRRPWLAQHSRSGRRPWRTTCGRADRRVQALHLSPQKGGSCMKVLVVDDDPLVCQSLKTILQADGGIDVVGMGHDGHEAVELFTQLEPDILLMDIRMEQMTGLESCERILSQFPDARVLFLTTFSDDEYIVQALRLGAKGYILKQDFESIIPALNAVYMGQSVFGDAIVTKLPKLLSEGGRVSLAELGVNEREQSIIELVAKGLSNREIAEALYLSEGTVRNYLSVILEKLELRDRTQLAVFYLKRS